MGGCAGCMGPNRRESNYKVTRLTQNAGIKSRISSSQLPNYKHQKKIISQINQEKRRLDQNNLIEVLASSPQVNQNYSKQPRLTSSSIYYRQPNQSLYMKENYQNTSILPKDLRRASSVLINENSYGMHSSLTFSNEKNQPIDGRSPIISDFRIGSFQRELSKIPLSQIGLNKSSNDTSMVLKKKTLLNIPEMAEQESKTPLYVRQMRKENGQDVLKTGLAGVPRTIETAQSANLFRYLKDLQ